MQLAPKSGTCLDRGPETAFDDYETKPGNSSLPDLQVAPAQRLPGTSGPIFGRRLWLSAPKFEVWCPSHADLVPMRDGRKRDGAGR